MSTRKLSFKASAENFAKIPGSPIAYWVGEKMGALFSLHQSVDAVIPLREGMHTGKNEIFLRIWFEVSVNKLVLGARSFEDVEKKGKWVPYNKGGGYRKWYGNNLVVVRADKSSLDEMAALKGHVRPSQSLYFKEGATWSAISDNKFGLRYYPHGFLFDSKGQVAVGEKMMDVLTLFNTSLYQFLANVIMPTLDYKCGDVKKLPYLSVPEAAIKRTTELIAISRSDWDEYETSWDFKVNPLVRETAGGSGLCAVGSEVGSQKLATSHYPLATIWAAVFARRMEWAARIKELEEENNRLFIAAYGLEDELKPDVAWKDVSLTGNPFYRYKVDSEEWLVVSGQIIEKERVAEYVNQELQRIDGVAEGDGSCGRDIRPDTTSAEGGAVCPGRPDAPGRRVDSVEHRGRAGTENDARLREFLDHGAWFRIRDGNAVVDLSASEVSRAVASGSGAELVRRGFKNAECIDWSAVREKCIESSTTHSPLTTNLAQRARADAVRELISYGIGCLMGRYSLEKEGLILASQGETIADYWKKVASGECLVASNVQEELATSHYPLATLSPDDDGIIPVVAGETAFTDNAPHRVVDFIKAAFGAEHLTENLNFIEATLGKTLETYLAKEFWDDHKRAYNNRPIYWLFRSKKGAFQALVYMHRMDAYTATKVRNGYLLPHIEFLRGRIAAESARGAELTAKERSRLKKMQQAMEECLEYDGRLHVVADRMQGIDLDDGVAVNYAKFGDVLAKLK